MTIDERLQFLLQSTESLHASCQELHAVAARHTEEAEADRKRLNSLDQRERRARQAVLVAMTAYLNALDEGQNGDEA